MVSPLVTYRTWKSINWYDLQASLGKVCKFIHSFCKCFYCNILKPRDCTVIRWVKPKQITINCIDKKVQLAFYFTHLPSRPQRIHLNQIWFSGSLFFLFFSYGTAHASFACQRWGLPYRLSQCASPGMGLV